MSSETSNSTLENLGHEDRSFPPEPEFTAQANGQEELYAQAEADYVAADRRLDLTPPVSIVRGSTPERRQAIHARAACWEAMQIVYRVLQELEAGRRDG